MTINSLFDRSVQWNHFLTFICISVGGYLIHTLPLFFTEKPLFLHHYLPSLLFQIISLAGLFHHLYNFQSLRFFNHVALAIVFLLSLYTFVRFLPLSYGYGLKTAKELMQLKWKSTWNFIVRRY